MDKIIDKYGKKIILMLGIIGLTAALYLLVSGVICLLSNSLTLNSEGFYSTWKIQINKDSRAIVLNPDAIGYDWIEDNTIQINLSADSSSNPVFIGIAGEEDIDAYLSDVEYNVITNLKIFPNRANYMNNTGSMVPENPVSQTFWLKSAHGAEIRDFIWEPDQDNPVLLVNESSSAGININLEVGTKIPVLFIAGIVNIIAGILILLISLFLVLSAGRSRSVVYPEPVPSILQKRNKKEI